MSTRAISSPVWTWRQAVYIGWLATPSWRRTPDTELAFSEYLHVRPDTLKGWRELPGFMPAVREAVIEALGELYADVAHKVEEQAAKGSTQHQKLYLQLFGEEAISEADLELNVNVPVGVDLSRVGRA